MQLFSAGELKGNWNRQTWSARVHKEISEDYFCNFRVNALFIILWIAEAKSGKDLRSLAEIRLALRGAVAAAGGGGREDAADHDEEEERGGLASSECLHVSPPPPQPLPLLPLPFPCF